MAKSLSMAMGYVSPWSRIPRSMLPASLPNSNSGACTPMTTSPSGAYARLQAFTYGDVRIQLTHVYSLKSTSTTFPRSPSDVSGGELTHRSARNGGRLLAALARPEAATAPRLTRRATFIMGCSIVGSGHRYTAASSRAPDASTCRRPRRGLRLLHAQRSEARAHFLGQELRLLKG